MTRAVYATRLVEDLSTLPSGAWDALLARQATPTPFMRHAYLCALQDSGSATTRTGWRAQFLLLEDDGGLAAACPAYLKSHSYGEYVFDWAWARAFEQHGLAYYPKLLCAVPFTPVVGSRLLARDADARRALAEALLGLARQQQLSSAHVLFADDADHAALRAAGYMSREGVQFHWRNATGETVTSFDAFLSTLQRHKRKNIAQERRRVADAGIRFQTLEGHQISQADWDFFHHCYTNTYAAHGSQPYLTRRFFGQMAQAMADHWLMFRAEQRGEAIAASLVAVDRERRLAYGRYWGCTKHVPNLHFEACYYQPLQWCIENGLLGFEGGAQGEHKMARGLLPELTRSAHWVADPRFADAVDDFLARERQGIGHYVDELADHSPFRPNAWPSS